MNEHNFGTLELNFNVHLRLYSLKIVVWVFEIIVDLQQERNLMFTWCVLTIVYANALNKRKNSVLRCFLIDTKSINYLVV